MSGRPRAYSKTKCPECGQRELRSRGGQYRRKSDGATVQQLACYGCGAQLLLERPTEGGRTRRRMRLVTS